MTFTLWQIILIFALCIASAYPKKQKVQLLVGLISVIILLLTIKGVMLFVAFIILVSGYFMFWMFFNPPGSIKYGESERE